MKNNTLERQAGCTIEQTLENKIQDALSSLRAEAGEICKKELHQTNSALIMTLCGSKGSAINIAQMIGDYFWKIISF